MSEELEKEIKRLEKYDDNTILKLLHEEDIKEIERLNNIIKEVREYIENNKQYVELEDYGKNGEYYIDEIGLLEILDKEAK